MKATERFLENEKNSQELLILKNFLKCEKKKKYKIGFQSLYRF